MVGVGVNRVRGWRRTVDGEKKECWRQDEILRNASVDRMRRTAAMERPGRTYAAEESQRWKGKMKSIQQIFVPHLARRHRHGEYPGK